MRPPPPLYYANPVGSAKVLEFMRRGVLGYIDTPAQGNKRPDWALGCTSVDGTHLTFGPDRKLPELLAWRGRLVTEPRRWA